MRPTDADALRDMFLKECCGECDVCVERCQESGECMLVVAAPTIDAVPVVRCKDCKNRGTSYDCPFRRLVFTEAEGYHYEDVTLDDSFCSFGERKEDAPCG